MTATYNIEISNHSVIYKLIDDVIERLESMLPPRYDTKVTGEAEIVQLFDIKINKAKKPIGGCKVINGVISIKEKCRITRNGKIIFDGIDNFIHGLWQAILTDYDISRTMLKRCGREANAVCRLRSFQI